MKVPFMDLRISDPQERQELLNAIDTVFQHGRIILGPEVKELEHRIAEYCGRKYAVGVGSGTDALVLGLKSMGIGPTHEVITTPLSWIATANAITYSGATPVFADIGNDLNIDPQTIESLITPNTKAIMPVHYTGKVCRMPEIQKIAAKHQLNIIEDASQAFGASLNNKKAGSFGKVACFSLNPMKVFAACGEAGMVLTDDEDIYHQLIALRHNGMLNRITCQQPGINGRIDTLQAAILLKRLEKVETYIERRKSIANKYKETLETLVEVPLEAPSEDDSYYTYTIKTVQRDALKEFLSSMGIETQIQHPLLMPQQPTYQSSSRGTFSRAQQKVKEILCLPMNEKLSDKEVDYVIQCIQKFFINAL